MYVFSNRQCGITSYLLLRREISLSYILEQSQGVKLTKHVA
jgi:hypothetical protein